MGPWGPTLIILLSSSACCQALYVCPTVSLPSQHRQLCRKAERVHYRASKLFCPL